jgi:hypothetical protein
VANSLQVFDSSWVRWRTIVHGTFAWPQFVLSSSMYADPAYGGLDPPYQHWQPRFPSVIGVA